jgi:hypothetical protein
MKKLVIFTIYFLLGFSSLAVEQGAVLSGDFAKEVSYKVLAESKLLEGLTQVEASFDSFESVEELREVIDDCFINCNGELFKK